MLNLRPSKLNNMQEKSAERSYGLLRSYLTLFQFRLPDAEKHEIRDLLSHFLDELEEKGGFLEDMDSYLEGFFFRPDPSVLKPKPTAVKIEIAQPISQTEMPTPQPTQPSTSSVERPHSSLQSPQYEIEALPEPTKEMLDS